MILDKVVDALGHSSGRSWELKLLTLMYLITAAAGLQRLVSALQTWTFLASLLPFSPLYLVLSGLLWVLLGALSAVWLWFNLKRTLTLLVASSLIVTATYWIERLYLYRNDPAQENLPFAVTVTLCALVYIALVIVSHNQRQRFFRKRTEHE